MPTAEKNTNPRGQAYGQGVKTQQIQQAGAEAAVAATPAFSGQASAVPATANRVPAEIAAFLSSPTARPEEPVTFGMDRIQQEELDDLEDWLPVLDEIAALPGAAPAVQEFALMARDYFTSQRG